MPETITDPKRLSSMTGRYMRIGGKYFQMFAGTSSGLTRFENKIIHLDVRIFRCPSGITPAQLGRNVAESYTVLDELKDAVGYVAHVYESHHPFGFALPGNSDEETISKTVNRFIAGVGKPDPDILLVRIEGKLKKGSREPWPASCTLS